MGIFENNDGGPDWQSPVPLPPAEPLLSKSFKSFFDVFLGFVFAILGQEILDFVADYVLPGRGAIEKQPDNPFPWLHDLICSTWDIVVIGGGIWISICMRRRSPSFAAAFGAATVLCGVRVVSQICSDGVLIDLFTSHTGRKVLIILACGACFLAASAFLRGRSQKSPVRKQRRQRTGSSD